MNLSHRTNFLPSRSPSRHRAFVVVISFRARTCLPTAFQDNAPTPVTAPEPSPPLPLISRALTEIPRKLLLLIILPPLFNLCYFLPQWLPIFKTPARLPLTWIDRIVPFEPDWIVPYLSMYILLLLPPLFATTANQLRRYTLGMAIMFAIAGVCFFLYPIAYPRPPLPTNSSWIYRLITKMDQPINSLPSLHAGLTVYALLFANKVFADISRTTRRALLTIGWLWCGIIFYGTLATKQHYLVDLPTGALLAWISHRLAWRK
jgi:hypothetical protein